MGFRIIDYIDRIIPSNGFIDNDRSSDMQFWKGYRIFVRDDLDEYESVEDWQTETGGFRARMRYEGYGSTTEYVFQRFSRGSSSIIDAGLRSYDIGLMTGDISISSVTRAIEREHMFIVVEYDKDWPKEVVNLHRRRNHLPEIYGDIDMDIYELERTLEDTTSDTALLELQRMSINEEEAK